MTDDEECRELAADVRYCATQFNVAIKAANRKGLEVSWIGEPGPSKGSTIRLLQIRAERAY